MDPKEQIASGATAPWTLTPLDEGEKHTDAASERALEVLRARDPEDSRYETADDPRIPNSVACFHASVGLMRSSAGTPTAPWARRIR